jgi:hypothetical protein
MRGVAQLVAHLVWDQRVVSSSLATPTKEKAWHNCAGFCFFIELKTCFHKQDGKTKTVNEQSE